MMGPMPTTAPLPRVNPDFLTRPRLLAALDRWAPVTVLLAPSGAGKAVLAVQWAARARDQGHDVLWLDGEVDEPSDVVAALARHAGLEPLADDAATLRRLRRALQGLDRRVALVLNNAEPVLAAIGDALVDVVRDCREVHLVACLRRRLDPVSKALLEAETRVLALADMQMTREEVRELAALHGLALSEPEAEAIRESVGGWPALVRTGLESLPDRSGTPVTAWSGRHVAWFLRANLIPVLPPSARAAACRAALVERPTYRAVLAATGPLDDTARVTLEAIGILDPMVSDGEPLVRLPPLMRDAFREQYDAAALGPASAVHEAVASYWREEGEPLHALQQAVAGQSWPTAVRIAEEHWWPMLAEDPAAFVVALAQLPLAELAGHPLVEVGRQLVLADGTVPESEATRTLVADLLAWPDDELVERARGSRSGQVLELLTLLAAGARRQGRLDDARRLADRIELVLDPGRSPELGSASAVVRRAALQAGTTRLLAGETAAAAAVLQRAVFADEAPGDPFAGEASGKLALCAALHGDRSAATGWLERWTGSRRPTPRHGQFLDYGAHVARAAEAVRRLDAATARAELAALREEVSARDELWPFALLVETEHALAWGGRSTLRAELATARAQPGPRSTMPWLQGLLGACEAELCTSLGRTTAAAKLLGELDPSSVFVALARARLARVSGHHEEALDLLAPVLATDHPFAPLRVDALLLAAWCRSDDAADPDAAVVAGLESAVLAARRERLVLPFSRLPAGFLDRYADRVPVLAEVGSMLAEAAVRSPYDVVAELPALTPREAAVLACLVRGLSREQTARELFVSVNTVKTQTTSIYRKLGARDRAEAVRRAYQVGLVD
ncbi:ATP-, maltotriose-and DNA-dependent transcriptional regulator MalT [Nocardioides lianchengensis]|uniref:ATP-, maltotriose-and DNA-dependent transcriptional regulator MalT n=2 Tax=Nocardioides lianchengensis TaxID=1045774 RepID=A0A1G6PKL9_9ACTN|nr:ATP-, maltotriose-and DNA-dependent transcriptional regulator MalT [Nocardioides lianchengensis]